MIGGGESSQEWTDKMLDSTNYIYSNTDNFSHYVAGGDRHCIIGSDDFYTLQSSGTLLFDWFEIFELVNYLPRLFVRIVKWNNIVSTCFSLQNEKGC